MNEGKKNKKDAKTRIHSFKNSDFFINGNIWTHWKSTLVSLYTSQNVTAGSTLTDFELFFSIHADVDNIHPASRIADLHDQDIRVSAFINEP